MAKNAELRRRLLTALSYLDGEDLAQWVKNTKALLDAKDETPRVIVVTDFGEVVAVHSVDPVQVLVVDTRADAPVQYDVKGDARAALALDNLDRGVTGASVVKEYALAGASDEEDAKCIVCGNDLTNAEEDAGTGYCADCSPDAEEVPSCPKCGGPGVHMGRLGNKEHYRCRDCGWDFSE